MTIVFKENCKTIVCDCGFYDIFKTTVTNCGFMIIMTKNIFFIVIMIKNILKIILKS